MPVNKLAVLLLTFSTLVVGSVAGFWVTTPIDKSDYPIVMPIIFRDHAVVDYQKDTGFLVDKTSREFLRDVTSISWRCLEKADLEKFMEERGLVYCFFGGVRETNRSNSTEISIWNEPVASRRFTGHFLCGGSVTFVVKKRLPSLLTLFFGAYDIERGIELVS